MNRTELNRINSNSSDLQKMNRTQLNRIKSNSEVLKRYFSTASVKEIPRKQKQLVRTREAKMNNVKINVYKKVLQELCEKFNGAEAYTKERIQELCSKNKLSVEEVTYLFMKDYNNF